MLLASSPGFPLLGAKKHPAWGRGYYMHMYTLIMLLCPLLYMLIPYKEIWPMK